MGLREVVKKTVKNRRGYKYHNYQTHYKNGVFSLDHYGTEILKVDLNNSEVIDYTITSTSDSQAIGKAIWEINPWIRGYFTQLRRRLYKHKDGKKWLYNPIYRARGSWRPTPKSLEKIELRDVEKILSEDGIFIVKEKDGRKYHGFKTKSRCRKRLKVGIKEDGDKILLNRKDKTIAEEGITAEDWKEIKPKIAVEAL